MQASVIVLDEGKSPIDKEVFDDQFVTARELAVNQVFKIHSHLVLSYFVYQHLSFELIYRLTMKIYNVIVNLIPIYISLDAAIKQLLPFSYTLSGNRRHDTNMPVIVNSYHLCMVFSPLVFSLPIFSLRFFLAGIFPTGLFPARFFHYFSFPAVIFPSFFPKQRNQPSQIKPKSTLRMQF